MSDDDETSDREGPIGIRVLLSSGELDEWTDTGGVRVGDEGSRVRFRFCPECGTTALRALRRRDTTR